MNFVKILLVKKKNSVIREAPGDTVELFPCMCCIVEFSRIITIC